MFHDRPKTSARGSPRPPQVNVTMPADSLEPDDRPVAALASRQDSPHGPAKPRTASWSGCGHLWCRATKTRPHIAAPRLAQAGWASGRSGRGYRLRPVAIVASGHEQNRLDFGCLDMILARADEIDTPGWDYLRRASVLLNAHAARYDRNLNPT